MGEPVKVFYSYSHKDEEHLGALKEHLATLRNEGKILDWGDRMIAPGASLNAEVDRRLDAADLVILLVSPSFLDSRYCYQDEMQRAFERHRAGKCRVIPVIVHPSEWRPTPLLELLALPTDGCAVSTWAKRDNAWLDVVMGIRRAVEQVSNRPTQELPVAIVHGRFQPLHNTHLAFLLYAKKLCRHLIVGLANPDPTLTAPHPAAPHRALPWANPFHYHERLVMVRDSLREAGLSQNDFDIVPFPINKPELLRYYVPMDATFFVTEYEDWGKAKRMMLDALGVKVAVLDDWQSAITPHLSGTVIRHLAESRQPWKHLVPRAVAQYIEEHGLESRLTSPAHVGPVA